MRYLHGISGFTRRLILQLLLEGEKVLVSVTSETPMTAANTVLSHNTPSMPPHPAHPLGHYHQLLYVSTQSTVADILQQVSGKLCIYFLDNENFPEPVSWRGFRQVDNIVIFASVVIEKAPSTKLHQIFHQNS